MYRRFGIFLALFLVAVLSGCAEFKKSLFDTGLSMERSYSRLDLKTVQVDGNTVSYLERQGAGDTIVLLHGFNGDKDNWVRFVRKLPTEYRIIAIDLPGHGSNARDMNATYSIEYITKGFADTAEALQLKRFHLAGNSMGGYVSAIYSSTHPEKVQTLCLIDPAGAVSPEPSDREIALSHGMNPLVPRTADGFGTMLEYVFHDQPFMPWPARSVLAERYMERSLFSEKVWKDIMDNRVEVEGNLDSLSMPVLLLWGDRDRIIHVSTVRVFKQHIPRAKTVIFKDCGHLPMLEIPKESALTYAGFLKEEMNQ